MEMSNQLSTALREILFIRLVIMFGPDSYNLLDLLDRKAWYSSNVSICRCDGSFFGAVRM